MDPAGFGHANFCLQHDLPHDFNRPQRRVIETGAGSQAETMLYEPLRARPGSNAATPEAGQARGTDSLTVNTSRHLDLGCGPHPRNPYRQSELYGVDIRPGLTAPGVRCIAAANLAIEPIPFPSHHFNSVSAYDFLEHIPRVNLAAAQGSPVFPFIGLMNEVWRVLQPGGIFYAVFPAYPHPLAFCDPTHVNVLTDKSHRYFTGAQPMARMYGFNGRFELVRQHRLHPRGDLHPVNPSIQLRLKSWVDGLMGRRSHLAWELRAQPLQSTD